MIFLNLLILALSSTSFSRDPTTLLKNQAEILRKNAAALKNINDSKNCLEMNVEKKLGPVRNQGGSYWCASYVAADLASFYSSELISASSTGLIAAAESKDYMELNSKPDLIDKLCPNEAGQGSLTEVGSYTEISFNINNQVGFCKESEIPSIRLPKNIEEISAQISKKTAIARKQHCSKDGLYNNLQDIQVVLNSIYDYPQTPSHELTAYEIVKQSCQNRIKLDYEAKSTYFHNSKSSDGILELQKKLNQNEPAGIAVNLNSLLSVDYLAEMERLGNAIREADSQSVKRLLCYKLANFRASHAVTVVGQSFNMNAGKCEVTIRNSWGRDCSFFKKGVRCNPKTGSLTLTYDELQKIIFGLTVLERK